MSDDQITRLNTALEGRYRIERELGEGGMATVYLADDLRHERKVALKVLKPELAAVVGAERFLAEIKTTANLQHPHILPLFDSGEADKFLFYVMPLVEGETLRQRLSREKQLPVGEAVRIAGALAEALDYAHRHGVIHRDIKPANVMIHDGQPVISDFGIALAVGAGGGRMTETGLSLGTPHYMSPEQATGDASVGPAADVWALGCVLYEMLVGEPPYTGSTPQAILGKIVTKEAEGVAQVRKAVPPNVDGAVRKALEKLPADRFATAKEMARALDDAGFRYGAGAAVAGAAPRGQWTPLAMVSSGAAVLFALLFVWALQRPAPGVPRSSLELWLPDGLEVAISGAVNLDISHDGSKTVVVASNGGTPQLWLRELDGEDPRPTPIRGTDRALGPRFSPNGDSIAFARDGQLWVVSLSGGAPRALEPEINPYIGLDWGTDGMIYFTDAEGALSRVAPSGDGLEQLASPGPDEARYLLPDVLPNGNGVLFQRSVDPPGIAVLDLDSRRVTQLFPGAMAVYATSGHVLFASLDGKLSAVRFDPASLRPIGDAREVQSGVFTSGAASQLAISDNGTLFYYAGWTGAEELELVWVDRNGNRTPVSPGRTFTSAYSNFGWSLSPTEDRVAITVADGESSGISIMHLPSGLVDPLVSTPAAETDPSWSSDGEDIVYAADGDIMRIRADRVGAPTILLQDARDYIEPRLGPRDEWVLFRTYSRGTMPGGRDIYGFRIGSDSVVTLVADPEYGEQSPSISPDGSALAYVSNRAGPPNVFLSPFPDVRGGDRITISTGGGTNPVWSHSGDELFYLDAQRRLMVAQVETSPTPRLLETRPLFTLGPEYVVSDISASYDVSLDDQRFLLGRRPSGVEQVEERLVVRQGFLEHVAELVP